MEPVGFQGGSQADADPGAAGSLGYSSSEIIDGDVALLSMNNIRPYGGYIADYSRVYSAYT